MLINVTNPNPISRADCVLGNTCYFYNAATEEIIRGHFSTASDHTDKISVFTAMTAAKYELLPLEAIFLDAKSAWEALTTTKDAIRAEYEAKMTCVEDILVFAYDHVIALSADTDALAREAYKNRVTELFPNVRL